jgi:hypothetical protein
MFETNEFRLNHDGIGLLRSRYCYKKFSFDEIIKLEVYYGRQVKRPFLLMLFASVLLIISVIMLYYGVNGIFSKSNTITPLSTSGIRTLGYYFFIAGLFLVFGELILYSVLKKAVVMKVNNKHLLPLTTIVNERNLQDFLFYIENNVPHNKRFTSPYLKNHVLVK